MTLWLILIPLLPAAAALVIALLRLRVGGWLAAGSIAASVFGLTVLAGAGIVETGAVWMRAGSIDVEMTLRLDGLSWWAAALVASICLLVTVYSIGYVQAHRPRFFALMSLFTASMLALVLAGSFPLLFVAWEGVGVASFALIAFHYRDEAARAAARKAFLMTRFGDVGLLVGWLLVLVSADTSVIETFVSRLDQIEPALLTIIAALVLLAAIGKSAQLPLSAWLPDAMAGPTPVSALLHSATMVAAGVYLLLRLFPLFERVQPVSEAILWVGAATAVVGALVATSQMDLKRVLAWSTVSQLGEMVMAIGFAAPVAAAFHLTTHAVFKSALFLAAGAVEREAGTRDLRELGGKRLRMPITGGVFAACGLSLAGFPLLSGFWSEEKILGAAVSHGTAWAVCVVALIALAGIYIGRAFFAAFGGRTSAAFGGKMSSTSRGDASTGSGGKSSGERTTVEFLLVAPMIVLAAAAVVLGFLIRTPLETVLPFSSESHQLGLWRWIAIGASVFGVSAGALRARAAGAAAALGGFPRAFSAAANFVADFAGRAVLLMGGTAAGVEQLLDRDAGTLSRTTVGLARLLRYPERGADAAARGAASLVRGARLLVYPEAALDAASRGFAHTAMLLSKGTNAAERVGFGAGIDRAAYGLRRGGGSLSRLESGKIFRYTLSLFVWVLVAIALVMVLWL